MPTSTMLEIGRTINIEAGATYVFDKGYCHYGWWRAIHAAGAIFVTRPKTNMGLTRVASAPSRLPKATASPYSKMAR